MATFFGEVIHPCSRAFFDDLDDDETDEKSLDFKDLPKPKLIKYIDVSPNKYEALILSYGIVANGFTQLYMLKENSKLVAEIEDLKLGIEPSEYLVVKEKKVDSTKLYLLENNTLLLHIPNNIDLEISNQLTLLLSPWLKNCKKVVSLVSQHISNYIGDFASEQPPAFVRSLTTSYLQLPASLKQLEQPNFISNVPASVLTWCEAQKIAGLLLVLYSDQEVVEELTVAPLLKSFANAGLSEFLLNQPTSKISNDSLKNMDKTFMYM